MAWTIDQYVTNRITFQNLESTAKDYFGLSISFRKLYEFKAYAAQYYRVTYLDNVTLNECSICSMPPR